MTDIQDIIDKEFYSLSLAMREIKFRGKAKSNGQWVYGNLSYREADDGHSCVYIEDQGLDGGLTEVDPESVGQYTGLKDANGVEIYEE